MTTPQLMDLRRVLLHTPGTVTDFLETITGELLVADVISRYSLNAGGGNALGVSPGHVVNHRSAVLKGDASDVPYLYAETIFVPERIPEGARIELEESNNPIGRVLITYGLTLEREALPQPKQDGTEIPAAIAALAGEIIWSRVYRLLSDDLPVFMIREWFLNSVVDALDRRSQS